MSSALDTALSRRPLLVAVAGPNGAGKSTFYHAFLSAAGVRFVNADSIGRTLGMEAYAAGCSLISAVRCRSSRVSAGLQQMLTCSAA